MKNLWYLVAAYSSIWAILAGYLFILVRRNKLLMNRVEELEGRLRRVEQQKSGQ